MGKKRFLDQSYPIQDRLTRVALPNKAAACLESAEAGHCPQNRSGIVGLAQFAHGGFDETYTGAANFAGLVSRATGLSVKMFFEYTRQFHAGEPLICSGIAPLEGLPSPSTCSRASTYTINRLTIAFGHSPQSSLDQVAGIVLGIQQYRELLRRLANLFQSLEQFSGACAATVYGYYFRAFLALVDGASKCRPVKIGWFKFLANRLNNFIKARARPETYPPPATADV